MYYADGQLPARVSKTKLCMPMLRAIFILFIHITMIMTYDFFGRSGSDLNSGIITSLFTSSVVYSAILFYFIYKQKISLPQVIGMALIVGSVIMVSIGGHN